MTVSPVPTRADPDTILAELHARYPAQLRNDIEAMRGALERGVAVRAERGRHIDRVFEIAHGIKGQAGTFGFPLVTAVADRLCVFVRGARRCSQGGEEGTLRRHLDALVLLADHDIRGDAGALGHRLLADLDELTASDRTTPRSPRCPASGPGGQTRRVPENGVSGE